ncbi:hypothetical protein [Desulfoluna sp.]|uniref:hypothetical protein n=1 Tax=Desulfoluna sp. TaxID=2045199 RepID=UPI00262380F8|nr:hypothetical protein [Desulfoluna sp.]
MIRVAKWLLLFVALILIVDNSLVLLDVGTPIAWMILASIGMMFFLGIGLILLGIGAKLPDGCREP